MRIVLAVLVVGLSACAHRAPKVAGMPKPVNPPTVMQPGMLSTDTPEYKACIETIVRAGKLNGDYRRKLEAAGIKEKKPSR